MIERGIIMEMESIEMNRDYIDYSRLKLLDNVLKNDWKNMGEELFIGHYETKIGFFAKTWRDIEFRYLLAVLEYTNPHFHYEGKVEIGKTIIINEEMLDKVVKHQDVELLKKLEENTPEAFRKYGFLLGSE
ncbi:MAG: hypothetical protein ACI4C1_04605 [Lachnospiraceae bacterium]